MDKAKELLNQLQELCKKENINLVAAMAENGDNVAIKRVLQGKAGEIFILHKVNEKHIEETMGLPIELIGAMLYNEKYK